LETVLHFRVTPCRYRRSEGVKYQSRSAVECYEDLETSKKKTFWTVIFMGLIELLNYRII